MNNSTIFFADQPMMLVNPESGDILDVNEAAIEWYGYSRSTFRSKKLHDLGEQLPSKIFGIQQKPNRYSEIYCHQKADGDKVNVRLTGHEFNFNDTVARLVVIEEVDKKLTDDEQEAGIKPSLQSEQKIDHKIFSILSEEALVGVYVYLVEEDAYEYVNRKFADIYGYDRQHIQDHFSADDIVHSSDRTEFNEQIKARFRKDGLEAQKINFRGITKGGETIHLKAYGVATTYQGKSAIVGTLLDATDDWMTVNRYQTSIKSYEDLFDSISDSIFIIDKNYRILEINESAIKSTGYTRDSLIGNYPDKLLASSDVNLRKLIKRLRKAYEGETQRFEQWGKVKDGKELLHEIVLTSGNFFGKKVIIALARDISDRYESQRQLRESEERFRQLFRNAPVPIAMTDSNLSLTHVNEAFTELFGYNKEEVHHQNLDDLLAPEEEKEKAIEISGKVVQGETIQTYGKRKGKDDELLDVLIYGLPVSINGDLIAIFSIYIDITDRKKAEERARKSLQEKEVLLAEIHHRVKNNLAVIIGLLELQRRNAESDEASKILHESQMRINSIALIHEKLYQTDQFSEIWFDEYLKELIEIIIDSLQTKEAQIDINISANPVELTIKQAIPCGLILNELITNAHQHAFEGRDHGVIEISLRQDNSQVKMKITDDGKGLPENILNNQSGSLGLKLVQTLTKQLRGESDLHNTDEGTEFVLKFTPDV